MTFPVAELRLSLVSYDYRGYHDCRDAFIGVMADEGLDVHYDINPTCVRGYAYGLLLVRKDGSEISYDEAARLIELARDNHVDDACVMV